MKVFISADMEGTNGISHWDETEKDKREYPCFAAKMTAEVAAVCSGINSVYPDSIIYVKDAHGSARNIDHEALPHNVILNRNWVRSPYSMMDGIDNSFDAAIFTGYHSGAGSGGNPMAHTMSGNIIYLKINGLYASEAIMNYYTSLYCGVPLVMAAGDEALCRSMKEIEPGLYTVASVTGQGSCTISEHPQLIKERLAQTASKAVASASKGNLALPDSFKTEIYFKTHAQASRAAYYPGARKIGDHAVAFDTKDYFEFLRYYMFVSTF